MKTDKLVTSVLTCLLLLGIPVHAKGVTINEPPVPPKNYPGYAMEQKAENDKMYSEFYKSYKEWINPTILWSAEFKITAYNNDERSTGKKPGHPLYGITASGVPTQANHTVAADWNVLPKGTIFMIEGLPNRYEVTDKGGAIDGYRIDLYFVTEQECYDWGVQHRTIKVIKWGGV